MDGCTLLIEWVVLLWVLGLGIVLLQLVFWWWGGGVECVVAVVVGGIAVLE